MSIMKVRAWSAGLLLSVVFVLLANDGRHHWHEFRYLYSASVYSTTQLMQGVFDPGPAPVRTPDEVAEWYVTELLHIYILNQLVAFLGVGLKSYTAITMLYAMMLIGSASLVWKALNSLGMSSGRSVLTAALFLISPLAVYLGFKLMGEVPSLFFATCALALFTSAIGRSKFHSQAVLSGAAGLFLALSTLSSVRMLLVFLSFWPALLLSWAPAEMKRSVARAGLITGMVFVVGMPIGLGLLGGSLNVYLKAFSGFLAFSKSLPMWLFAIFNLGLFGTALWFFVPLAWLSPDYRRRRFFLVWLLFSAVPIMVMAAGFLEPRYLVTALIPFAGLATLGLEAVWDYLRALNRGRPLRAVTAVALAVVVIGGSAIAQPLMPYESDTDRLVRAVQGEAPRPESTVILVPWNYSDFHFLRFVFPDRPIYLVQSAATETGEAVDDPVWTARFAAMYGEHYLRSADDVPADFSSRRVLYIGWTVLPSLQNLRELFISFGLNRLAGYLEASHFRNHMAESWLVHDSRFAMREISQYGQYGVYEVKSRLSAARRLQTASTQLVPSQEVSLWGIFETVFHNNRQYSNPFADTELEAAFLSPTGKAHNFFGFYDGDGNGNQSGNIWKLRFMCTELGVWRWAAEFSDGVLGGSGSFECVKSSLAGPLEIDKNNPHWLKKANGEHFLPRWYYLHELLFTKEGDWQQDVDNLLVRNRYNMVAVLTTQADVLVSNQWNRREYDRPFFYPWTKKSGGTVLWNSMDVASWRKLDRVLEYLRDRDIYVYFFDGFFPNIAPRFPDNPIRERLYLRYALARLGAYSNVTHNITFEFSEFMAPSRLNRIGRYIKEIDPFNLLLTAHDTQDFAGLVEREPWLDYANLQYREGTAGSADTSNQFVAGNFYGKPVAATEMVWEGRNKLDAEQVRRGAWGILMAGGFFLYGEFDLGGTGVGDFGLGKAHPFLKIMLDYMESVPYWEMNPHNELVVERGSFCLANPGKEYVIYVESGGAVTADLSAASGSLSVKWLNPRTGELTSVGAVKGGGPQIFTSPLTSEGDWVLHLAVTKIRS
jgi:hypothetical protein